MQSTSYSKILTSLQLLDTFLKNLSNVIKIGVVGVELFHEDGERERERERERGRERDAERERERGRE
jgi:hypothetical protein